MINANHVPQIETTPVGPIGDIPALVEQPFVIDQKEGPWAVETQSRTLAETSDLQQLCAEDILAMPDRSDVEAVMNKPGKRNQEIFLRYALGSVAADCNGHFTRLVTVDPQLMNWRNHKQWFHEDRPRWQVGYYSGNKEGEGGHITMSNGHQGPNVYFHKTPGPGQTQARFILRLQEQENATGNIVATSKKAYPITVKLPPHKR